MAYFFITVITIIIIVIITITIIVTMMMTMAPGLVWNFGEAELSGSSVKLKLKELDRRERCLHHHDGEDGDDHGGVLVPGLPHHHHLPGGEDDDGGGVLVPGVLVALPHLLHHC